VPLLVTRTGRSVAPFEVLLRRLAEEAGLPAKVIAALTPHVGRPHHGGVSSAGRPRRARGHGVAVPCVDHGDAAALARVGRIGADMRSGVADGEDELGGNLGADVMQQASPQPPSRRGDCPIGDLRDVTTHDLR